MCSSSAVEHGKTFTDVVSIISTLSSSLLATTVSTHSTSGKEQLANSTSKYLFNVLNTPNERI